MGRSGAIVGVLGVLFTGLTACAQPPADQAPAVERFTPAPVERVIREKCTVEIPPAPASPLAALPADANIFDVLKSALAEVEFLEGYVGRLKAAAKRCE